MKTKLIKLAAIVFAVLGVAALSTAPVFAEDICQNDKIPAEVKAANGCPPEGGSTQAELTDVVRNILTSIILILGTVAVVFVVIGGVNYMTSTGDPGKVKKAKDTILYALIGLVICALAFAIVNFTINIINGADGTTTTQEEAEEQGP